MNEPEERKIEESLVSEFTEKFQDVGVDVSVIKAFISKVFHAGLKIGREEVYKNYDLWVRSWKDQYHK